MQHVVDRALDARYERLPRLLLRARGEQKTITLFMKSDGGSGMTV